MKQQVVHLAQQKRQRYNHNERAMIVYGFILLFFLLVFPLIRLDYLNSTSVDLFTLFNGSMTKTRVLVLIFITFLIVRNGSYRFKRMVHATFGYSGQDSMTNVFVLAGLVLMMFSIGDTTGLLKQQFSTRISSTSRFLIIGLYLIGGIARQLIVTRLDRKKERISQGMTIKQETDTSKKERHFHQVEKEFKGLFTGEEENN